MSTRLRINMIRKARGPSCGRPDSLTFACSLVSQRKLESMLTGESPTAAARARARGYRPSVCLVNTNKIQIKRGYNGGQSMKSGGGRSGRARGGRDASHAPTARPRRRRARTLRPWPARSGASRRRPRRERPRRDLPSTGIGEFRKCFIPAS